MMKIQSGLISVVFLSIPIPVFAKRIPPRTVPPVQLNGVEYSAPHKTLMGYIVATDIKTKKVLWQRQIYKVEINLDSIIEEEFQWCFITSIKLEPGKMVITNEKNYIYELNLKSLQVRAIKGSLVIQNAVQ